MNERVTPGRATGWTVVNVLVVIYALLPVLWILSLSLKPTSSVKDGKLIPTEITFANYKGIFDDKGRLMVIVCHNTDLGDGWEREGEDEWYFHEFGEKRAYPMGINIVFYAMTH